MAWIISVTLLLVLWKNCASVMVTYLQGSQAELVLDFASSPDDLFCQDDNENQLIASQKYNFTINGGVWHMFINNVDVNDVGDYLCQSKANLTKKTSIYLAVVEKVVIVAAPQDGLSINDPITITCRADIRVDPTQLFRDNENPTLYLDLGRTNLADSGSFMVDQAVASRTRMLSYNGTVTAAMETNNLTCRLASTNQPFISNTTIKVNVYYAMQKVVFANSSQSSFEADDNLVCTSDGYPPPAVTWTRLSGDCQTPPRPSSPPGCGCSILKLTDSCQGPQSWNCTSTYSYLSNVVTKSLKIDFTVVPNGNSTTPSVDKAGNDGVGLGVGIGIGLGVPILLAIIGLIAYQMRKKKNQGGGGSIKKTPPKNETKSSNPSKAKPATSVNPNPNPAFHTPVLNQQVKPNSRSVVSGSPGVPDIGVAHLGGSGSIPQLNTSFDTNPSSNGNGRPVQGRMTASVNLGNADLGFHNHSFTNI